MSNPAGTSRILALTSWRGIFAVCIVLFHCRVEAFTEPTKFGVTFFFVVSGFLLEMKHRCLDLGPRHYAKFIGARALRLYAMHWAMLAAFIAMAMGVARGQGVNWDAFVPNLLFVQIFSCDHDVIFSFNGHMWFLGDLLLCYALYPLLRALGSRMNLRSQVIAASAVMALLWVVMGCFVPFERLTACYTFPPIRIFEFWMGMVLCHCFDAVKEHATRWTDAKVQGLWLTTVGGIVAMFVLTRLAEGSIIDYFNEFVMWQLPVAALVLLSALTAGRTDALTRLVCSRPLLWLGELSLEIYILQAVAGQIYAYLVSPFFGHFGIHIYDQYAVGIFFVLLPLAWLCRRYFTRPLTRWVARIFA
ncbi:MAG: acyltransferase [Bacteroidales bacterium]|nr:acyltransferase [Bacteroidales bacterium]